MSGVGFVCVAVRVKIRVRIYVLSALKLAACTVGYSLINLYISP